MLEPAARDSAMAPSFHVRSGSERPVIGAIAADPNATADGENAVSVLPARGPATASIVWTKKLQNVSCITGEAGAAQPWRRGRMILPKVFRSICRKGPPVPPSCQGGIRPGDEHHGRGPVRDRESRRRLDRGELRAPVVLFHTRLDLLAAPRAEGIHVQVTHPTGL